MRKWKKSNLPKKTIKTTVVAVIVEGGSDWGFAWSLTGEQIERLENLLIELAEETGT